MPCEFNAASQNLLRNRFVDDGADTQHEEWIAWGAAPELHASPRPNRQDWRSTRTSAIFRRSDHRIDAIFQQDSEDILKLLPIRPYVSVRMETTAAGWSVKKCVPIAKRVGHLTQTRPRHRMPAQDIPTPVWTTELFEACNDLPALGSCMVHYHGGAVRLPRAFTPSPVGMETVVKISHDLIAGGDANQSPAILHSVTRTAGRREELEVPQARLRP